MKTWLVAAIASHSVTYLSPLLYCSPALCMVPCLMLMYALSLLWLYAACNAI